MKDNSLFFNRIGIIGVGLIGSSFALAMRERKCVKELWGYSLTGRSACKALELGIVDKAVTDLSLIAENCDLVFVSTPVLTIPSILHKLSEMVDKDVIVTDGGSVKNFVLESEKNFRFRNFVGSHPIAGTEKSGPEAGFSSLFDGSTCIVTPTDNTDVEKLFMVQKIWQTLGMEVVMMSPEEHDEVMAYVSHMPHAIAFSLVTSVKDKYYKGKRVTTFAGGGFRDFTRIAKSDVNMWRDIFLANRENILKSINEFDAALKDFRAALEKGDSQGLESYINDARGTLLVNEKK